MHTPTLSPNKTPAKPSPLHPLAQPIHQRHRRRHLLVARSPVVRVPLHGDGVAHVDGQRLHLVLAGALGPQVRHHHVPHQVGVGGLAGAALRGVDCRVVAFGGWVKGRVMGGGHMRWFDMHALRMESCLRL